MIFGRGKRRRIFSSSELNVDRAVRIFGWQRLRPGRETDHPNSGPRGSSFSVLLTPIHDDLHVPGQGLGMCFDRSQRGVDLVLGGEPLVVSSGMVQLIEKLEDLDLAAQWVDGTLHGVEDKLAKSFR